jgi:hypothetical protein
MCIQIRMRLLQRSIELGTDFGHLRLILDAAVGIQKTWEK